MIITLLVGLMARILGVRSLRLGTCGRVSRWRAVVCAVGRPCPGSRAVVRSVFSETRWSYQRSYSTSSPVSTVMGDVSGFDSRRRHFILVCN